MLSYQRKPSCSMREERQRERVHTEAKRRVAQGGAYSALSEGSVLDPPLTAVACCESSAWKCSSAAPRGKALSSRAEEGR